MAALVGGAFLNACVQTMIDKLASTEFRDYVKNSKLNVSLLGELKTTLLTLQAVLDDAEEKQITKHSVKQWLDELKDAIFDAEDLLNQINTHFLQCKVENTEPQNITNQVWNFLSSPFKGFYREINSQMENMCHRLQSFEQQTNILGLQTVSGGVCRRTPPGSMVKEVVGRKDNKGKLVEMLFSESGTSNNNIGVVAILGMGGVGKTTLAQLLYNDEEVKQHFRLRGWACVSEDFDILRITKTLLESVTEKTYDSNNLDFLRAELMQTLRDKRFLLVLDDMWNDNYNDWDDLVTPLIHGKIGSKVIITTRQQRVADVTHTFPIHRLEPMSDDECWSILSKHAFRSEDFSSNEYPNLEEIGKKIAKKCHGLPLAAKALAGILRRNVDAKEWTKILNSKTWDLPKNDILPALRLSYQHLPSHLKRCFAYCSIFPKDYSLDRKQLVLLWMAEGFIQQSQGEKAMEEIGDDYFVELLSRSLIQQSNGGESVMHDLVHDLARTVSGKSCHRLEDGEISETVRHLSYNREDHDISKKFEIFYKFKLLRSFLPLSTRWWFECYLSTKVIDDLLPTLGCLRVLSLSMYRNITMLPDSIGSLVQLRYLDLSGTGIKSLPDTACNLYNLQTLILSGCYDLTELPVHIGKLVNLRHLDVSYTKIKELPVHIGKLVDLRHLDISETAIKEMPMQIVELKNLRTLTVFVVGKQQVGLSVGELRKFPHLQGKFSILKLHNVIGAVDARDASLKSKEQIVKLVLQWGKQTEDSRTAKDVLRLLEPSVNLKKLNIYNYGGTSFPCWLGDPSFSNMVSLCIQNCEYCITLPPLGQLPSLEELKVGGMKLDTIGPEFYGTVVGASISSFQPFPSLERLEFTDMSNWKEWLPFESGDFPFPCLKTLKLSKCPELRGCLPNHLSSIEEIEIAECDHLLAAPPTLRWLSSIKRIDIVGGAPQWPLLGLDSPCLLQSIRMENCVSLLSLPKMILSSGCLQTLNLWQIPSLTAFPANGLPTSLESLTIVECKNLAFLPPETWCKYTSLVKLFIVKSCHSLTSFPLDGFPVLRSLEISDCSSLESIFISESSSLLPPSLQSLWVSSCNILRSLPQRINTLTALETLELFKLPELELSFSEGAWLPPKLRTIKIDSVRLPAMGITEWGFQRLTALSHLVIGGDDIVNALLTGQSLPISLVSLRIKSLSNMKSLEGSGLRHLTSLERLQFDNCPRLESLPENMLPSSLKILKVKSCPLLEARFESQRGEHGSNIAQIPVLIINGRVII